MTQTDWEPEALIEGVRAELNPDGTLNTDRSVEVRVNYTESKDFIFDPEETREKDGEEEMERQLEKWEPGEVIETEYRNGAYARLRYEVNEEGTAHLAEFKDASPSDGNWISVQFLRVVDVAEQVVANVPGVEDLAPAEDVFREHINDGARAEVRRA